MVSKPPPRKAPHFAALRKLALASFLISTTLGGWAGAGVVGLDYFLPATVEYDPEIPPPASVLGYEVGEWHVRPEQLVEYAKALAAASDRVTLEIQSYTHEHRPQVLLVITSPRNQARLEEIRRGRHALFDPRNKALSDDDLTSMPAVVFLGYSIHGNEASGANASLLAAYHFAAGDGEVERQLENVVILLDPSLNPDGLARFASWVNSHRGAQPVGDRQNREHNEAWPGGRTNHYWFDLNRDWLLLQHPESRGRVSTLHRWKPNLVGDFHEMGTDSTFFFQPGVPVRKNPLIPERNVEITEALARYHAALLDQDGRLYYTQEGFDDFYPGKGSTYPDLQGAIGVLFEQASVRGHVAESGNGELTFPFAIKNHFLASRSMVQGLSEMRLEFLRHQRDFFVDALEQASRGERAGFVFGTPDDPIRTFRLVEILERHDIEVSTLARDLQVGDRTFEAKWARFVSLEQPQFHLIRALFETVDEFSDSTFYDVTTWTLPLAFDAEYAAVDALEASAVDGPLELVERPRGTTPLFDDENRPVAYAFEWSSYLAPRALYRLQQEGISARVATQELTLRTDRGERPFATGTVIVPTGLDSNREADLIGALREIAEEDAVDVYAISTGLASSGIDVGSPSLRPLEIPRVLIVGGRGVSGYEVGEAWYLLDYHFGMEVSIVETERIAQAELERYSHIVLPNGSYGALGETGKEHFEEWVRAGGTLVGIKGGARWAGREILGREEATQEEDSDPSASEDPDPERRSYESFRTERAAQLISGTIFQIELDLTHPLAYGYSDPLLPVFRTDAELVPESDNPYENVAFYSDDPLLSGYVSSENRQRFGGAVAVMAARHGSGVVVQLLDNPNFRSYFQGNSKLFLNTLFFSGAIDFTSAPGSWLDEENQGVAGQD